jgi:DNA-binding HxlR family transcriptional regulator
MKQEVTKKLPIIKSGTLVYKQCAVIGTLKLFASKWKPCIICYLLQRPMRYNELYRTISNISRKMLSEHLHELISDQLVIRIPYDRKMQRVEYEITDKGRSLLTIFYELEKWGLSNIRDVFSIQEMMA